MEFRNCHSNADKIKLCASVKKVQIDISSLKSLDR